MKAVRILLLVLFALALPLRGALADLGHCTAAAGGQVQAGVHAHHGAAQAPAGAHAHAHAKADADAGVDGQASASDPAALCKLCSGSCTATAFMSAPLAAAHLPSLTAVAFPALAAPPPSHPSDGLDRPPRNG